MCREYDHFARYCPSSREERDLEQLQHMLNMEEHGATTLPLDYKIGGQDRDSHHTVVQYLTREQARYIYKKTETG